jgi:pimeloyl-ACP methyl ester carboxylesterase
VLLIHGFGALIEHWRRFIPCLRPQHTVCAFDLHNFGYSTPLSGPPSSQAWTQQAAHVLTSVFDEPAIVIGHSMGGLVASHLARDYPHLVRGMVLVNSVGLPPEREPTAFERTLFGMVRTPGVGELLAEVITNAWSVRQGLVSAYWDKERVTPELVEAFTGPLRKPNGPKAYLSVSRALQGFRLNLEPGEVQTSTLIAWGEGDRAMPMQQAEQFRQQFFPHAEVHIIPETAHCPFDERPEAFADVVLPWIAGL